MLHKFPNQKYITMNTAYSDILNISHFYSYISIMYKYMFYIF